MEFLATYDYNVHYINIELDKGESELFRAVQKLTNDSGREFTVTFDEVYNISINYTADNVKRLYTKLLEFNETFFGEYDEVKYIIRTN